MSAKERLESGVRVLEAIERAREKSRKPEIGRGLEAQVIDREIAELEREWSPAGPTVVIEMQLKSGARLSDADMERLGHYLADWIEGSGR